MKNVCSYICILLSCMSFAQESNNHWQMSSLDFDFSNNPLTINNISGINHDENFVGASISDANGDLLFYFDGVAVRNRNHQIMSNGYINNLSYGEPFLQTSIIIPHPGDVNKFILFWNCFINTLCTDCTPESFYFYSVIDFTNNPLGEVLEMNGSVKKHLLNDGDVIVNEGNQRALTYTADSNGGFWVLVEHDGKILSFNVGQSGVNETAVNAFPSSVWVGDKGIIRAVPDYLNLNDTKIYISTTGGIDSFDFDKSTGVLSNRQQISLGSHVGKDFELSSDNSKIYVVVSQGKIIVKDLSSPLTSPRILNEYANPSIVSSNFGFLQKDKYDNILVGGYYEKNNYIHRIQNSNSFQNSSVEVDFVYLNNKEILAFTQLLPPNQFVISCIDNITLSSTEMNNNYTYEVDNVITTNNNYSVYADRTITYKAGQAIIFKPNTHLKIGSVVHAKIEECQLGEGRPSKLFSKSREKETQRIEFEMGLVIYPNPTSSASSIELKSGSMKNVTISSLEGKKIFSSVAKGQIFDLSLEGYMSGVYIVTVETEDGKILTKKLIKN